MPFTTVNGVDTYYEEYGEGRPLVVVHGANADHQVWAEQLQPLTSEYRVILFDLRGHGKTGGSELNSYSVDTFADDLDAFIESLELDSPIVIGHSLGGMVGYVFASEYPERLSALITVGAMTPMTFSTKERVVKSSIMRVGSLVMGSDRLLSAFNWLQLKLFGEDSTVNVDEHQQIRDAHRCEEPDVEPIEQAKTMDAAREYVESSRTLQLSEIPTLMLYGEDEPMIDPHAEYLDKQFQSCRSVEIPEGSHNAQVDSPVFVREQIREFLSSGKIDSMRTSGP
jgi:3-oxoadipate enol-lactonase